MRRMRFCSPGTRSGGSSTPRSPRATMMASDASTIASRRSSAAGFSSLASKPARSPINARASCKSSGRCTKDSATQSTPSCSAKSRSRLSFSVSAGIGNTASGTLTPLRSDSAPPLTTRVRMRAPSFSITSRRNLPSSSNSACPAPMTSNNSGCGRQTRWALPDRGSLSSTNSAPASRAILPCSNWPTRSLGPCRSASTAMGRPWRRSTSRTMS